MRQLLPLRPACCSKISLPTTTMTETFPRSATSFRAPPCQSAASQPGRGRSGFTHSLPQAHLETGQYKNSLCLEAAQYNSPVLMDLLRLKRSGEKKTAVSILFGDIAEILGQRTSSLKVFHVCRCGFRVVTGCFRPVSCAEDCDSARPATRIGGELLKLHRHKLCARNMFCLRQVFFPQGMHFWFMSCFFEGMVDSTHLLEKVESAQHHWGAFAVIMSLIADSILFFKFMRPPSLKNHCVMFVLGRFFLLPCALFMFFFCRIAGLKSIPSNCPSFLFACLSENDTFI